MIIVTGATGQLGRAIVERLLSRVPAGQIGVTGELILPEDGPVSWTAHADLAEAAASALTEEGRLDGITPALTGPQALDFAAVDPALGHLLGRTPVTFRDALAATLPA
jgi:uncharacterized protein YbjT (DUF2867 family)